MKIIENLSFSDYCKIDAVNQSSLKLLNKSPAHLRNKRNEDSPSKSIGRAYDSYLLTPSVFYNEYVVLEDIPRAGSKARKEIEEANPGKSILSNSDFEILIKMKEKLEENCLATGLLKNTKRQLSLVWTELEDEGGLLCKARPDCYSPEMEAIIDLKTTRDASTRSFQRDAFNYGYFNQADFYLRGANACGLSVSKYYILAQETEAPYGVKVYLVGESSLYKAQEDNTSLLRKYKYCIDTDEFPCYTEEVELIEMPDYALS